MSVNGSRNWNSVGPPGITHTFGCLNGKKLGEKKFTPVTTSQYEFMVFKPSGQTQVVHGLRHQRQRYVTVHLKSIKEVWFHHSDIC